MLQHTTREIVLFFLLSSNQQPAFNNMIGNGIDVNKVLAEFNTKTHQCNMKSHRFNNKIQKKAWKKVFWSCNKSICPWFWYRADRLTSAQYCQRIMPSQIGHWSNSHYFLLLKDRYWSLLTDRRRSFWDGSHQQECVNSSSHSYIQPGGISLSM